MLPPDNLSIKELSDQSGIPQGTLYNWRQHQILKGITMPSNKSSSSKTWTPEQKLAAVVETYAMNNAELNEYCRGKGLYSEQIKSWRRACLAGHSIVSENRKMEDEQLKKSKKKIKSLERELHRKEKALAESAALLTLGKKYDAYWAEKEDS